MLELKNVSVSYGSEPAVSQVSFCLKEGQWLMLTGPNGAGKSTLLRAVCQGVPYEGEILLDGQDLRRLSAVQRARRIGVLSQHHPADNAFTVGEAVALGRYAHRGGMLRGDADGAEHVERALAMVGLTDWRYRRMDQLSGGEMQRAYLAQVLAQDPDILLLDEPANHLDLPCQKQIFTLIGSWLRQPGHAVLAVVHDLSLARRYGTHALLMSKGVCTAQGSTDSVFTRDNLQAVYGMDVHAWMREALALW